MRWRYGWGERVDLTVSVHVLEVNGIPRRRLLAITEPTTKGKQHDGLIAPEPEDFRLRSLGRFSVIWIMSN